MKICIITGAMLGISAFAFAQTNPPKSTIDAKQAIPQKMNKADSILFHRPEVSVISIIPTLKLWMLPANIPNPFMKDEE
jgi:hypothetical protein